ncbi:MAG TPA: beta-propeller fold lactonase family protein [Acidobacteriaceae bacterium]|nr:beta-propeller fold lactonase family protein [Acidobacteriaceae bacterium]
MKLSRIGRISQALVVSMALVLGMSACGGYTVGFMWVPGTQYNQIAGFKIDDYTGNLTKMINSPYSSGGTNPVSISVRVGGNFVFVANKGTSCATANDGNVSVFSVGNDGVLTFQQSYTPPGCGPVWVTSDNTGSFVYVLMQQAPDFATTGNGAIVVYAVDGATGRLQLVPNQLIKNAQGQQLNYFEVGPAPTMLRLGGACVFTLDGDQTVYPYGVGANGQLTVQTNTRIQTGGTDITSITVNGSDVYLTDAAPVPATPTNPGSTGGSIRIYTIGSSCSLSAQATGVVNNLAATSDPVYSVVDSKGKYLYVVNHGTTNSHNANSTISAYNIDSATKALTPISDPQNPYAIGNGPVCIAEDPSNQYLYTSNSNDGTVTGKFINSATGELSDLSRGSTFQATGLATCLAISGNVD